jgi:hypothetical protein
MLIFFIHGVATRNVKYAESLKAMIRESCVARRETVPHFHSGFWGNALSDVSKMWYQIYQSLQELKSQHPQTNSHEIFRYQSFREGLLSEFVGDMFTYLNPERGYEIRNLIAQQLAAFIKEYPQETDLHFVTHSLGSVILWDILFSHRFSAADPAFHIRSMIHGFDNSRDRKIQLGSITTMGSPILFFNTMLGIDPAIVGAFAARNQNQSLRWLNILHSSDIIAYPLKASLQTNSGLKIRDVYLCTDVNLPGKMARVAGQMELAMALEASEAHNEYWNDSRSAELITAHILDDRSYSELIDDKQVYGQPVCLESNASVLQSTIDFFSGLTQK